LQANISRQAEMNANNAIFFMTIRIIVYLSFLFIDLKNIKDMKL